MADGIPAGAWGKFCDTEGAWFTETDREVMTRGWLDVEDVMDTRVYPFVDGVSQRFLQQVKIRSFQGIALTVEDEMLGVLYVNYHRPRSFSLEQQNIAKTFASHAASALKKAKLLNQVKTAWDRARVVAEVTSLGNLEDTLHSIAEGTMEVVNCDAVTLHNYDQ